MPNACNTSNDAINIVAQEPTTSSTSNLNSTTENEYLTENNSNENINMRSNDILELNSYIEEIEDIEENAIAEDIEEAYSCEEESIYEDHAKRIKERVQEEASCRFPALGKKWAIKYLKNN